MQNLCVSKFVFKFKADKKETQLKEVWFFCRESGRLRTIRKDMAIPTLSKAVKEEISIV